MKEICTVHDRKWRWGQGQWSKVTPALPSVMLGVIKQPASPARLYVSSKDSNHWQTNVTQGLLSCVSQVLTKPQLAANRTVLITPNIRGTLFFSSTLTFAIYLCFSKLIYSPSFPNHYLSWLPVGLRQTSRHSRLGESVPAALRN